jgi:hypothetical protein
MSRFLRYADEEEDDAGVAGKRGKGGKYGVQVAVDDPDMQLDDGDMLSEDSWEGKKKKKKDFVVG